ncbi:MAG: BLUF domain-containing protein [Sphingomicrobium sp.]
MKQLIYRSEPFGFDSAILAGILVRARHNNRRNEISGALICRNDVYLQLIEGPAGAIDALYAKILVDDRHCDITLLLSDTVEQRIFPEWTMLDDQFPSMAWSPEEISGGAIDTAPPEALLAVFERIAAAARDNGHAPN